MNEFGRWGSATEHERYSQLIGPTCRRLCHCGCNTRATHSGMANGVCLYTGCELSVARWVRDATPMPRLNTETGARDNMSDAPMKKRLARAAFSRLLPTAVFDGRKFQEDLETKRAYASLDAILQEMLEPSEGMKAAIDYSPLGIAAWKKMIQHLLNESQT